MFYNFVYGLAKLVLKFRIHYEGQERIPAAGALILIANHRRALDPVAMALAVGRPVHFLAKKELSRSGFGRWFMNQLLCIPVDRDNTDRTALRRAIGVLKDGGILGIFPEGTRSLNDELLPFKSGGSYIASQSPCTFVPMSITGTERLLHFFQKPVDVKIGEPFPYEANDAEKRRDTLARMTKKQEEAIRALLP